MDRQDYERMLEFEKTNLNKATKKRLRVFIENFIIG